MSRDPRAQPPDVGALEGARRRLGVSAKDVWIGYFAVGGNGSLGDVEQWLSDAVQVPTADHNFLAQAINDQFVERGLNHPVAYRDLD